MKRTVKSPIQTIIQTLARVGEASWTELKNETKLSKGALSENLNLLIKWGQVIVAVNTSAVPKKISYSLAPVLKLDIGKATAAGVERSEFERQLVELAKFSVYSGHQISLAKDRNEAKNLLMEYLNFNLDALGPEILLSIVYSLAFSRGFMKGSKKTKAQLQYDVLVEELRAYCRKFIEPWIESIAFTTFLNQDLIDVHKTLAARRGSAVRVTFFDKIFSLQKSAN